MNSMFFTLSWRKYTWPPRESSYSIAPRITTSSYGCSMVLHRIAVRRRRADDAEVARAHEAELQRARDRRGGERERVHRGAQGLQLVLHVHAELLLFVDDQQAEVLVLHVLAHQAVRADEDVDLAFLQVLEDLRSGPRCCGSG